ncbi:Sip1-related alpha-galactosidase [Lederbergia ruris]|uniref:Sip1-related alpha-galactosidase n=1 Tax=Lederbergia ruris TaxID=217495 RepID=UPI0039A35698
MFQSKYDGELLQIENENNRVLGDLQIQVNMDGTEVSKLQFVEEKTEEKVDHFGQCIIHEYIFKDQDKISFSLIFHCYESFLHAYVDIELFNERLFERSRALSPENGVTIHVKNIGTFEELVAHYRHKDWWTRPYFKKDLSNLPSRTQSLLWYSGEEFHQLLPICDSVFKSEMKGAEKGFDITISSLDSGRNQCKTLAFVLGRGGCPFALSEQLTKNVLSLCGQSRAIDEKRYPERLDHLGWCSWDAFYQDVNESGILSKAQELKEKQVPVKWIMIDDGWSTLHEGRLSGFESDKRKFPNGLKSLTDQLKDNYNVDSVGVWHTLAGYWGGIDPSSTLADKMSPYLYKTNSGKQIPYPKKGKGFEFWDAWHSYLQQQGIDFVKVDGQSAIQNFMMGQMSVGEASLESHKALEASVGIHFDQCMINCMGMAPENIWNRPISAVSRSSDDFVPDDENGFAEHALQNAYNSFYHGELFWGDWDMFWTKHRDAKRHALLRAVSGGPIYTSDPIDQTDPEVIKPLIYSDGRILRCDHPGKPTKDILMKDPTCENVPLKIWNTSNGVGILTVFNIHLTGNKVYGNITPSDIEALDAKEYIVYDYFQQEADVMKRTEVKEIALEKGEHGLFFIFPKEKSLIPIGLTDKYISPDTFFIENTSDESMTVRLKEGGHFAFYSEVEPKEVRVNEQLTTIKHVKKEQSIYTIDCSYYETSVIIEFVI